MIESHEHAEGVERSKFGMWLFLASEVMFFGGFIGAFIVLKSLNPELFHATAQELNWKLATVNTVALICSSLTMALAVHSAHEGNNRKTAAFTAATIALAGVFLVIKFIEYKAKFDHEHFPSTNMFYGCYFTLTGFHGLHVIAGIIALGFLLVNSLKGKYTPANSTGVEMVGLYWHLVDVVWIFLFPMLYLLP